MGEVGRNELTAVKVYLDNVDLDALLGHYVTLSRWRRVFGFEDSSLRSE